jgi:hypothetical protein
VEFVIVIEYESAYAAPPVNFDQFSTSRQFATSVLDHHEEMPPPVHVALLPLTTVSRITAVAQYITLMPPPHPWVLPFAALPTTAVAEMSTAPIE